MPFIWKRTAMRWSSAASSPNLILRRRVGCPISRQVNADRESISWLVNILIASSWGCESRWASMTSTVLRPRSSYSAINASAACGISAAVWNRGTCPSAVTIAKWITAGSHRRVAEVDHALAFVDGGDLGLAVRLGEEAFEVGGEGEVGLAVGELGVEGVDLVAQVGFPGAQVGHAGAELVDGDQLLAEGFDHAGDRGVGLGQCGVQGFPLPCVDRRACGERAPGAPRPADLDRYRTPQAATAA